MIDHSFLEKFFAETLSRALTTLSSRLSVFFSNEFTVAAFSSIQRMLLSRASLPSLNVLFICIHFWRHLECKLHKTREKERKN